MVRAQYRHHQTLHTDGCFPKNKEMRYISISTKRVTCFSLSFSFLSFFCIAYGGDLTNTQQPRTTQKQVRFTQAWLATMIRSYEQLIGIMNDSDEASVPTHLYHALPSSP
jgi:hypothetical protein